MGGHSEPVLKQFAVVPRAGTDMSTLRVDATTGLLREPGSSEPYVEQLFRRGAKWLSADGAATLLTESGDPVDPDLIRASSSSVATADELGSPITKADADSPDPDLIRAANARTDWMGAAATTMTKVVDEPHDPDLIRVGTRDFCQGWLETTMTHADGDQPDPDLVRDGRSEAISSPLTRAGDDDPDPDLVRLQADGRAF
jgi:hypothetical protein